MDFANMREGKSKGYAGVLTRPAGERSQNQHPVKPTTLLFLPDDGRQRRTTPPFSPDDERQFRTTRLFSPNDDRQRRTTLITSWAATSAPLVAMLSGAGF